MSTDGLGYVIRVSVSVAVSTESLFHFCEEILTRSDEIFQFASFTDRYVLTEVYEILSSRLAVFNVLTRRSKHPH